MVIETIVWYIFLADSLITNLIAWSCPKWYGKKYKKFSRVFPLTKGWGILYLALVLWVGFSLSRLGVLGW